MPDTAAWRPTCPASRSDKPTDDAWYPYGGHTAAVASLFEELNLRDVTLVVHDWGDPIGLRVAATELPERVARLVVMDTGVFTGRQSMSDAWLRFRDFVAKNPAVPVERPIRGGSTEPPPGVWHSWAAVERPDRGEIPRRCPDLASSSYPRREPLTALLMPTRNSSFLGHPSPVAGKVGRNCSESHISLR